MIIELILFMVGCIIASECLKLAKLKTAWIIVSAPGIPLHELGHVIACLLFRVPIKRIDLLHVRETPDGTEVGGSVTPGTPGTAFSAIALAISPIVSCWLFIELFIWLFLSWPGWGFDPAWQWLLLLLMVSTGMAAAPSGADLSFISRAARGHPGQFLMAIGGIVLGGIIICLVNLPVPEELQVIASVVVVFGPGWVLSTIYAKFKG
jgi:hypothetical protein